MPKLPRDISGRELARLLKKYGYQVSREVGSHIRLESSFRGQDHRITIPDHSEVKIGTLNNILNEVAAYLGVSKFDLAKNLFA
ncbi:MAG: type II toxin-antitoxin system HicA family toxin [bacterium]